MFHCLNLTTLLALPLHSLCCSLKTVQSKLSKRSWTADAPEVVSSTLSVGKAMDLRKDHGMLKTSSYIQPYLQTSMRTYHGVRALGPQEWAVGWGRWVLFRIHQALLSNSLHVSTHQITDHLHHQHSNQAPH